MVAKSTKAEKKEQEKEIKDVVEEKMKETAVEKKTKEEVDQQEETGLRYFLLIAGLCLVILAALVIIPRVMNDGLVTLEDYHKANRAGKDLDNAYMYNSYSFVYYDNLWYTQILNQYTGSVYDVPLHYAPKNVTDIAVAGQMNVYFALIRNNTINSSYLSQTYLTFDPDNTQMQYVALASGELTQNLARTFSLAFIPACTKKDATCGSVPVVSCENTKNPVIYLKEANETAVFVNKNCITIQGKNEELVRATDRLLFKLYNIMN